MRRRRTRGTSTQCGRVRRQGPNIMSIFSGSALASGRLWRCDAGVQPGQLAAVLAMGVPPDVTLLHQRVRLTAVTVRRSTSVQLEQDLAQPANLLGLCHRGRKLAEGKHLACRRSWGGGEGRRTQSILMR